MTEIGHLFQKYHEFIHALIINPVIWCHNVNARRISSLLLHLISIISNQGSKSWLEKWWNIRDLIRKYYNPVKRRSKKERHCIHKTFALHDIILFLTTFSGYMYKMPLARCAHFLKQTFSMGFLWYLGKSAVSTSSCAIEKLLFSRTWTCCPLPLYI